ncbi:MAG: DUF3995 domain-containing protein [Flavobacteriaceae bacterium]|nr:DUF3995 domain-containing protein [Flavobacteriaceae bacterium]
MIDVLTIFVSMVLAFLAGLHFYWGMFGIMDISAVVPTDPKTGKVLSPGRLASVAVGLVLLCFTFAIINKALVLITASWFHQLPTFIGLLFLLRAFGDFRYVGFTKKHRQSKFARLDTRYYSPLCLLLGGLILVIQAFS